MGRKQARYFSSLAFGGDQVGGALGAGLQMMQAGVTAVARQQLFVSPLLDDAALVKDEDAGGDARS